MFFLVVLRCYKDFAPPERRHQAAKCPARTLRASDPYAENARSTNSPRVMWIASFPGAVIDGVSFVDCIFRGVRSTEVVEAAGSILFRNVKIEPAEKGV